MQPKSPSTQPNVQNPGNAQMVTTSAGESKLPEGKVPEIVMVSTENGGTYVEGVSLPVKVTLVAPARKSSKLNDAGWASTRKMAANATKMRRRSWAGIRKLREILQLR
jgi:hypothetical protein